MKKSFLLGTALAFFLQNHLARADFFGGDIPLLAEVVANTLQTLTELEKQTALAKDQMDGIKDRISRLKTISNLVQPSTWSQWKDPAEALRRLREIYFAIPSEYQSEKSKAIEADIANAMTEIASLSGETKDAFLSGKELEKRGVDASPGVAQKLIASGTGTLIAIAAQTQVIESHITDLLAQTLASSNEREARSLVSSGSALTSISEILNPKNSSFADRATVEGVQR